MTVRARNIRIILNVHQVRILEKKNIVLFIHHVDLLEPRDQWHKSKNKTNSRLTKIYEKEYTRESKGEHLILVQRKRNVKKTPCIAVASDYDRPPFLLSSI